ncbi:hypothetical protein [Sinorhizobium sp. BG8]|uniref:hypothetical protein n=1 Tax=Sinorhizobium sp. BG8 TaxID=2613773 RepID=UPI00193E8459|nr:hypothetical protein [Sinorhizobium sp. BG8]QRM54751.1 hypothetical protein F3Y30_09500 [Sinorhizobium sp. BG8]
MTIENTSNNAVLHSVFSVRATRDEGVYILDVDLTDMNGERYRCDYVSAPDDTFGLGPVIRQWLIDNEGSYEIAPFVAPTVEELRASMLPLSRVAFRTAFKNAGMTTAVIIAAVMSVADDSEQEDLQIAWEDAQSFNRLDPLVVLIALRAGKTAEEIDAIWSAATAT